MTRRTILATAAAITLVLVTGAAAVAANVGLLGSATDTDDAVAAALDAAARGIDRVAVPVAGSSSQYARQVPNATHSTTRAI